MTLSARFLPVGLGLVALLCPANPVRAQSPDPQSPSDTVLLSLPVGQAIACNVPTSPAPALMQLRQFRFGAPSAPLGEWPRRISLAADSGGHPLALIDIVSHLPARGVYAMAQFSPNGDVSGWRQVVEMDSAAATAIDAGGNLAQLRSWVMSARSPGPLQPLDSAEQGRAHALAAWLWERRCARP